MGEQLESCVVGCGGAVGVMCSWVWGSSWSHVWLDVREQLESCVVGCGGAVGVMCGWVWGNSLSHV